MALLSSVAIRRSLVDKGEQLAAARACNPKPVTPRHGCRGTSSTRGHQTWRCALQRTGSARSRPGAHPATGSGERGEPGLAGDDDPRAELRGHAHWARALLRISPRVALVTAYFEDGRLTSFGSDSAAAAILGERRTESSLLPSSQLQSYEKLLEHGRGCEVCRQSLNRRQLDPKKMDQQVMSGWMVSEAMEHRPDLARQYWQEWQAGLEAAATYGLLAVDVGPRWRAAYVEAIARAALKSKDPATHAEALRCIRELRRFENALTELGPLASKVRGAIVDNARPLIIEAKRILSSSNGGRTPKSAKGIEAVVVQLVTRNPRTTVRQLWESIPSQDDSQNKSPPLLAAGYEVYRCVSRSGEEVLTQASGPKSDKAIKRSSFNRYVTKARKTLSLRSK